MINESKNKFLKLMQPIFVAYNLSFFIFTDNSNGTFLI